MTAGLVSGQRATDRNLQLAQLGVGLLLVRPGEEVDVLDLSEGLAQFSSLAHDRKRGIGSQLRELCIYLCTQLGVVLRAREQGNESLTLRVAYRQQADVTLAVENVAFHHRQGFSTGRPVRQQVHPIAQHRGPRPLQRSPGAHALGSIGRRQSHDQAEPIIHVAISQKSFDLYIILIIGQGEAARSTVKPETQRPDRNTACKRCLATRDSRGYSKVSVLTGVEPPASRPGCCTPWLHFCCSPAMPLGVCRRVDTLLSLSANRHSMLCCPNLLSTRRNGL